MALIVQVQNVWYRATVNVTAMDAANTATTPARLPSRFIRQRSPGYK